MPNLDMHQKTLEPRFAQDTILQVFIVFFTEPPKSWKIRFFVHKKYNSAFTV